MSVTQDQVNNNHNEDDVGSCNNSYNMQQMNSVVNKRRLFSRNKSLAQHSISNESNANEPKETSLKLTSEPNDMETIEKQFEGDGLLFRGKLIGHEFVAEARGELMCQQSMKKLKILQRGLGGHKRRVHIYISFDGIKVRDSMSSELLYHHSVPQISFISRDETDSRAFGYVFGSSSTGYQFIAIKTQKEAMPIMSAIGQLFTAALQRKKKELNGDKVDANTGSDDNMEKVRRESSVTLKPSRSESPNLPSTPAPPPPSVNPLPEDDFFSSFDPIESFFENDWKEGKEQKQQTQMPLSGDNQSIDPFASSFGSLSLSSNDWANFDEENLSGSAASSFQLSQNCIANKGFAALSTSPASNKNNENVFLNDSNFSVEANNGFHSPQSNASVNVCSSGRQSVNSVKSNSEALIIPQRSAPSVGTQSVASSSSDRYACFAEINSLSSSIFDSLCDQIANEDILASSFSSPSSNMCENASSKSLNSSLNGGFGLQRQLSSSYNGTFFHPYAANINNPHLKQENIKVATNRNVFNDTCVWPIATNPYKQNATPAATRFSTSPQFNLIDTHLAGSALSPHSTQSSSSYRCADSFASEQSFADLDPFGSNRPYIDKSQFFAEQKMKKTLKDINSDDFTSKNVSNGASYGGAAVVDTSVSTINLNSNTQASRLSPWCSSQVANASSNKANPFCSTNDPLIVDKMNVECNAYESVVQNTFNPFSSETRYAPPPTPPPPPPTPPPPVPPPRPPSRECPPVPPRHDLGHLTWDDGPSPPPPLPSRRITTDCDALNKWSLRPSESCNDSKQLEKSGSICSPLAPPPLPNPQRRPQRNCVRDPFNFSFVESQLSSLASNLNTTNGNNNKTYSIELNATTTKQVKNHQTTSTPKEGAVPAPPPRQDLKLSEILSSPSAPQQLIASNNDDDSDVFFQQKLYEERNSRSDFIPFEGSTNSSSPEEENKLASHVSPPERNIFIAKSDPFDDEFFSN